MKAIGAMPEQISFRARAVRIIGLTLKIISLSVLVLIVVGAVGAAAIWGHYWGFPIGSPTADACATCHTMQTYVESMETDGMLAQYHGFRDITCTDCHQHTFEQQLHELVSQLRGDYQTPLTQVRYSMDKCFECHQHGSYEQIRLRTTDLGISDPQAFFHEANPHRPPHYDDLECHSCHRIHRESTLLCTECHAFRFRIPPAFGESN
jgi:cytochrome c nitrite reductase small subunit